MPHLYDYGKQTYFIPVYGVLLVSFYHKNLWSNLPVKFSYDCL